MFSALHYKWRLNRIPENGLSFSHQNTNTPHKSNQLQNHAKFIMVHGRWAGAFDRDSLASIGTTPVTGCFSLGLLYTIYPSVKKILKIRPLNFFVIVLLSLPCIILKWIMVTLILLFFFLYF